MLYTNPSSLSILFKHFNKYATCDLIVEENVIATVDTTQYLSLQVLVIQYIQDCLK